MSPCHSDGSCACRPSASCLVKFTAQIRHELTIAQHVLHETFIRVRSRKGEYVEAEGAWERDREALQVCLWCVHMHTDVLTFEAWKKCTGTLEKRFTKSSVRGIVSRGSSAERCIAAQFSYEGAPSQLSGVMYPTMVEL